MEITTLDLEIAVIKMCNPRQNLTVPNVSFGIHYIKPLHECDIISLTSVGYATEYEIKVSKADFKKDFKKKHKHDHVLIRSLYYVYPEHLHNLALEIVPEEHGLIAAKIYNGEVILSTKRAAKKRKDAVKFGDELRYKLARLGTLRILPLKEKLAKACER